MSKATLIEMFVVFIGLGMLMMRAVYTYIKNKANSATSYMSGTRVYQYMDDKVSTGINHCMDEAEAYLSKRSDKKNKDVSDTAQGLYNNIKGSKGTPHTIDMNS